MLLKLSSYKELSAFEISDLPTSPQWKLYSVHLSFKLVCRENDEGPMKCPNYTFIVNANLRHISGKPVNRYMAVFSTTTLHGGDKQEVYGQPEILPSETQIYVFS